MSSTVYVDGISAQTSEDEVKSFFSFCGKIASLKLSPAATGQQSAIVAFEKAAAAKTALLLDNTQLGPNSVHVTAGQSIDQVAEGHVAADEAPKEHDVEQEDKPRRRIIAEYLAHGYAISDQTINRALELDKQHGISTRFTSALKAFDGKFQATQKAQAVDSKLGVTEKALTGWRGMTSYYDKVAGTPTGQKLRRFYDDASIQVWDVHQEARHLADLKAGKPAEAKCECGSAAGCSCAGKCTCAGKCACAASHKPNAEEADVQVVPGSDKTTCNCGADAQKCACPPEKCSCAGCAK